MSRSRKHVTLGLDGDVQPPGPGQAIVRALGSRGSNVIEVEFPDGRQTLVLMPAKFNKKLWVKRGGFVMVEDSAQAEGDTKVTGTIVSVLYDDQIKQLQKMEGVWPKEFAKDGKGSLEDMMPPSDSEESDQEEGQAGPSAAAVAGTAKAVAAPHGGDHGEEEGEEEDDDDGLPPLQQNTNRKVVYHEVSESDEDDDDD